MRRITVAAIAVVACGWTLTSCDSGPDYAASHSLAGHSPTPSATGGGSSTNQDLAAARAATAAFHRHEAAIAAGWSVAAGPCVEHPTEGGMGYHYLNPGLANDAEVSVTEPEILVYEPQRNGRLRLVALEYVVPYAIIPPTGTPPELYGMAFHQGPPEVGWALHAWVWKHNPSGMFSDWNPNVSCEFAAP
jgi:hypothetical protein